MLAVDLIKQLAVFGVDEKDINDRFVGNTELYKQCFLDFLEEPNLTLLAKSIDEKDYVQAFASAHALKGLSANLGLNSFYEAICGLVELLRCNNCQNIETECFRVFQQLQNLKDLIAAENIN